MRSFRRIPLLLVLLLAARPAAAQLAKGEFPPGFHVRLDDAKATTAGIVFVSMEPGWHITTGPAAILYSTDSIATGGYRLESTTFLFDPGERNEAYGIFIGGRALEGPEQGYTYFVIRRSGEFLVKQRKGGDTSILVDWTRSPSIVRWDDRGDDTTAKNVLAVDAGQQDVAFLVNGTEVARLPRSRLDADGVFGLRVNHSLNIHVSSLSRARR
jgi:hypothetical protein